MQVNDEALPNKPVVKQLYKIDSTKSLTDQVELNNDLMDLSGVVVGDENRPLNNDPPL